MIPIPKFGKDPTNLTNYCSIALTCCICKTIEQMINHIPVWYLESHNLLINVQWTSDPDVARKRLAGKLSSIIST